MRPRLTAGAVGVALLMVVVTSCSSSSTESKPVAAPVLTLESATTWYGRASEVAHPCQVSSKAVDDALDAAASESAKSDTNVPVMLAAGQAVEDCTISADSDTVNRLIAEMDPVFPDGTALVRQWIDAMAQADRDALLAAATNLDSRQFVGALFDDQRRADELADQFENLVATTAESLGVAPPTTETLYHWNPPEH